MTVDLATRVRMSDMLSAKGYAIPPGYRHSAPVVVWKTSGCTRKRRQCRVLRAFRSPNGWLVLGDNFRVPPDEWLRRVGTDYTMEQRDRAEVYLVNLRKVRGVEETLPNDLGANAWSSGELEVGCDHGCIRLPLSALLDDCRAVQPHQQLPVERLISWS